MSPLIFHRLGQNLALATVNNFKKKPNKDVVTFNEVLNCQIQKKKLLVIHGVAAASYIVKLKRPLTLRPRDSQQRFCLVFGKFYGHLCKIMLALNGYENI